MPKTGMIPKWEIRTTRNNGGRHHALSPQSVRFDANKFTPDEAKQWLKDHDIDYIEFEPASE